MNIVLEATYTPGFTTLAASGAAADADSLPTCAVYEDTTSTAIVTPTVVKLATGVYVVAIPCTAVNGFEAGKTYNVVISATIGGVAAKAKVAQFVCVVNGLDAIAAAVATRLSAAGYTIPPTVSQIRTEIDSNSTALAALAAGQSSLASGQSTINTNVNAVGTTATAIYADTHTNGVKVADKAGYSLAAGGADLVTPESGVNVKQALSLIMAAVAGQLSGAATSTIVIKNPAGNATRLTVTTDADGNRTLVVTNPPA